MAVVKPQRRYRVSEEFSRPWGRIRGREGWLKVDPLDVARHDLGSYMALVHKTDTPWLWGGQAVPAEHHKRAIEALVRPELGHTLILMPRGAGKTTLAQAWIEWELGRASLAGENWANDFRVLYFMDIVSHAKRISDAIRGVIEENEYYHALFPRVRPHKRLWQSEAWKVEGNEVKDPNFIAAGVGGSALSARGLYLVFDDICTRESMASATQKLELLGTEDGHYSGWLDDTALPMLVPWGRMVMLCTRWSWWDGAAWAQRRGWHELLVRALQPGTGGEEYRSYWPERWSVEDLLKLREVSSGAFAKSYQNEVTPEEGLLFKREWFSERFDYAPGEVRMRFDSWDTAFGTGRNRSYSAGLSLMVSLDWHVYVVYLLRGQYPYAELKRAVKEAARMNGSAFSLVEKKQSGHALIQDDWMDGYRMVEFNPFGQKGSPSRQEATERITALCSEGRVHLPSEFYCRNTTGHVEWLYEMERELFSYPDGNTDDIVDALCQALYYVEQERVKWMTHDTAPPLVFGEPGGTRKARV